eukprot:TRINITY_DN7831_c0_g2_i2.p1 TRINITY_DN7831_c0_g2~~TRINITY_DN7831_c0_g2_i2.p1  ORF type:complete len:161 (+),score=44.12 TRINITY_DN7831_c0_g2_i2:491-973(+)
MANRVKAAIDARTSSDEIVIMARTDALASEGLDAALGRAEKYVTAGADMLFVEACIKLDQYQTFGKHFPEVPILANITEFGKTPYFTRDELKSAGVSMVLYPLSAHRAMAKAAIQVFQSILEKGHQKDVLHLMQTREELYQTLDYYDYEKKLDSLFGKSE